jgi:hypothetical protein
MFHVIPARRLTDFLSSANINYCVEKEWHCHNNESNRQNLVSENRDYPRECHDTVSLAGFQRMAIWALFEVPRRNFLG